MIDNFEKLFAVIIFGIALLVIVVAFQGCSTALIKNDIHIKLNDKTSIEDDK